MNAEELFNMLSSDDLSDEEIENKLSKSVFYLSDFFNVSAGALSDEDVRLDTGTRRCSVMRYEADEDPRPVAYESTKILAYVLDGRIYYQEYSARTLTRLDGYAAGVGELLSIPPGTVFSIRPSTSCIATLLEIALVPSGTGEKRVFSHRALAGAEEVETPMDYYYGYDDRYQRVYEEGAELWETAEPNEPVVEFLQRYDIAGKKVLDLGCGEGRDSVYMARLGGDVVGVDVSRAALEKARNRAQSEGLSCQFLERDVIYLRGVEDHFIDLAVNMGCLHMLSDKEHRVRHLRRVYEVLKPGGMLLLAHCQRDWLKGFYSIPDYEAVGPVIPGRVIERRIRVANGTKMVPLPLLPFSESRSDNLIQLLEQAGFQNVEALESDTYAFGNTAVLIARKPLEG